MKELNMNHIINQIEKSYKITLSESCKKDLLQSIQVQNIEKNSIIIKGGQYSNTIYFIIKGSARAYYLKDGKEITDWFAFENDFITSINGYFLSIPSPYFVEVLENSIIVQFSRDVINELSKKHHSFTHLEKSIVAKTMLQLQERIVGLQFQTASEKYMSLLNIYPQITQRVPLTQIAAYLGITLETLSRIRNSNNKL